MRKLEHGNARLVLNVSKTSFLKYVQLSVKQWYLVEYREYARGFILSN